MIDTALFQPATLPWDESALSVVRRGLVRKETQDKSTGQVTILHQDGRRETLSEDEFDALYFQLSDGSAWKPKRVILQAICIGQDVTYLDANGKEVSVPSGTAFLRRSDGCIWSEPRHLFSLAYQIVTP